MTEQGRRGRQAQNIRSHHSTINDVVLTICGGGLRKYLQRHEELPEESLVAVYGVVDNSLLGTIDTIEHAGVKITIQKTFESIFIS